MLGVGRVKTKHIANGDMEFIFLKFLKKVFHKACLTLGNWVWCNDINNSTAWVFTVDQALYWMLTLSSFIFVISLWSRDCSHDYTCDLNDAQKEVNSVPRGHMIRQSTIRAPYQWPFWCQWPTYVNCTLVFLKSKNTIKHLFIYVS